jgi:chaperonin GroES
MSNITRLSSVGSAGFRKLNDRNSDWENQKRINMFKVKGLYPMFLKLKVGSSGYILPGFDSSLHPEDSSRGSSIGRYRDINKIDQESMLPEFTDWVVFVDGYNYYGKGMSTFVSPATIGKKDPIIELRKEVYRRKRQGDNSLNYLVELPQNATMQDKIILPGAAKEKPQVAEVVAVGPGGKVDGKDVVMSVKVGDRVIVSKYAGTEIKCDGREYNIVRNDDILAIVE